MFNWGAYSFSLLAIFVIGGRAFTTTPPTPDPDPPCTDGKTCYDYYEETHNGRYTGPWTSDTLSCFDRVPAVIRVHNFERQVYSFEADEKPSDSGGYQYVEGYARDSSTKKMQSISNHHLIYYLNANDCAEIEDDQNGIYPLNKEAIWQITIPEGYVAHVVLTDFHLEQPQSGNCINDFVSMYIDSDNPEKLCSSPELVSRKFTHEGLERLTIKFQSNEANNAGGFSGAVWIRKNNVSRSQRDLETVSAAEEEQSNENDETKQAIECLFEIAKNGKTAAEKYKEDPPNKVCKEMAKVFLENKNMGN